MEQGSIKVLVDNFPYIVKMAAQGVGVRQRVTPNLPLDLTAGYDSWRLSHKDLKQLE